MKVVTSYENPDTDGVGAMLGYVALASLHGDHARAAAIGDYQAETRRAAELVGARLPDRVTVLPNTAEIVLVDTHNLRQLPTELDPNRVVEIIDHHTGGDPSAFPRAKIQNEAVGAACTLIFERLIATHSPDIAVGGMLAAGIYSNTLGFRSPATHVRDRKAYDQLLTTGLWSTRYEAEIEKAGVEEFLAAPDRILFSDCKRFAWRSHEVAVFQIERADIIRLTRDLDLKKMLLAQQPTSCDRRLLIVVDPGLGMSRVIGDDPSLVRLIAEAGQASRLCEGDAAFDRVIQRKTDVVPILLSHAAS